MANGDFILYESHAIMRYLHETRKCPDHCYPKDPIKRAKIDQYLDWHHTNLRVGVGYQVFKKLFGARLGQQFSEKEIEVHSKQY